MTLKKKAGVEGPVRFGAGAFDLEIGDEPVDVDAAVRQALPGATPAQAGRIAADATRTLLQSGHVEQVEAVKPPAAAAKRTAKES